MLETWVQSLGQGDLLEEGMASRSSILAWRIPRTEEPGGLQSIVSQRVRHDGSDLACTHSLQTAGGNFNKLLVMSRPVVLIYIGISKE